MQFDKEGMGPQKPRDWRVTGINEYWGWEVDTRYDITQVAQPSLQLKTGKVQMCCYRAI